MKTQLALDETSKSCANHTGACVQGNTTEGTQQTAATHPDVKALGIQRLRQGPYRPAGCRAFQSMGAVHASEQHHRA